jgi:hypothetical protein
MLRGSAMAALFTTAPPALATLAAHPDAELIAWCDAFPAARDRCNAHKGDLEDGVPVWDEYSELCRKIGETNAMTLEGWWAKALAAKAEATMPSGAELPECTSASVWAWDLLNDMLRLRAGDAA